MVAQVWGKKYSACLSCNSTERPHKARGRCSRCYPKLLKRECSRCKKINVIARKLNSVCASCNKRIFTPIKKRECSLCGNLARIDKLDNSKSICSSCNKKFYYRQPKHECYNCKEIKIARGFIDNNYYCNSCYYYKFYKRPVFPCDICNKISKTSSIINNKRFCHSCYKNLRREYYIALKLWCRNKSSMRLSEEEIKQIIDRDKQCVYCGNKDNLTFDHIISVINGGKSEINNLVLACRKCNLSKNKSNVFQWCKRKNITIPNIIFELLKKAGSENRTRV